MRRRADLGGGADFQATSPLQASLDRAPIRSPLIPAPGLLARLLEPMAQHVLRVRQGPAVRQQLRQSLRARIHRQLQDHVAHIGPRLESMPLRSRDDRAQHRRSRARAGTPQEHPVLPADRLVAEPPLRHVVVDRQPAILRVPTQRLSLVRRIRHRLRQRRLRQQARGQPIQLTSEPAQDRHRLRLAQRTSRMRRPAAGLDPRPRRAVRSSRGSATHPPATMTSPRRTSAAHAPSRPPRLSRHSAASPLVTFEFVAVVKPWPAAS